MLHLQFQAPGGVIAYPPCVDAGEVVYVAAGSSLFALTGATGKVAWSLPSLPGYGDFTEPVLGAMGALYVYMDGGFLVAVGNHEVCSQRSTQLSEFPPWSALCNCTRVDLSDNHIRQLAVFTGCGPTALVTLDFQVLNVSSNNISVLPSAFNEGLPRPGGFVLDLSNNSIGTVEPYAFKGANLTGES